MKYYYLKLKEDFFSRDEIKIIECHENGYEYITIILKMYLRSLKMNGKLCIREGIPYRLSSLASVLGHKQETVKYAVEMFKELGLITIHEAGDIFMEDLQAFVGKSSTEAERVRRHRARARKKETEFEKALKDFRTMRAKIKKPLTERAEKRLMTRLEKLAGSDEKKKIAILDWSIYKGWQDVYPLEGEDNGANKRRLAGPYRQVPGVEGKYEDL